MGEGWSCSLRARWLVRYRACVRQWCVWAGGTKRPCLSWKLMLLVGEPVVACRCGGGYLGGSLLRTEKWRREWDSWSGLVTECLVVAAHDPEEPKMKV